MTEKEKHGLILRITAELHTQLLREVGEQIAKTGKRSSVNGLIVSILEAHFAKRGGKRG